MPSGKKKKRHKMSTHKRKKRLRKNRHKSKEAFVVCIETTKIKNKPSEATIDFRVCSLFN